jgi:hypothetical protein
MPKPERVQRSRAKGWQMPEGAIYVGRPTKWGNPFGDLDIFVRVNNGLAKIRGKTMFASDAYRLWLDGDLVLAPQLSHLHERRQWILTHVHRLAGRTLVCWCRELMPCHADVLIELANAYAPADDSRDLAVQLPLSLMLEEEGARS